jgi:tetratricopeptide (TPR) repeat protein
MRRSFSATLSSVVLAAMVSPAHTKTPEAVQSVWTGCGENKVSGTTKFMMGPTAARALTPKVSPAEGISRCTAEMAALAANAGWERRAALLRSRAKFYVADQQPAQALNDLAAIAKIQQPDPAYARSFAVSLDLLSALAHVQAGQRDEAARYAFSAMSARPWSSRIAELTFALSSLRSKIPTSEKSRWDNLILLDGDYRQRRAVNLMRAGDWQDALTDWQNLRPGPGEVGQTFITLPNVRVTGAPGVPVTGVDIAQTAQAALTASVLGQTDLAQTWLTKARQGVNQPRETTKFERSLGVIVDPSEQLAQLDKWSSVIEIAALIGRGQADSAATRFATAKQVPLTFSVLALAQTCLGKLPAEKYPALQLLTTQLEQQLDPARRTTEQSPIDYEKAIDELPDHEDVMLANPYRSTVKFIKANGFSVKVGKDGKTATVGFFGNKSSSFAIGEMALLRAADLTIERGKSAFIITSSSDYTHSSQMTMYGSAIGPATFAGRSTSLNIAFVEATEPQSRDRAIEASAVQAALRPIYVKAAPVSQ